MNGGSDTVDENGRYLKINMEEAGGFLGKGGDGLRC